MCHEQQVLFNTTDILTHMQLSGYPMWFSESINGSTGRSNYKWDKATCFGVYTPWKLLRALLGGSNTLGIITRWQSQKQNMPFACSWETDQKQIRSRWHNVYCIPYKCGRNYMHKKVISKTMWHQERKRVSEMSELTQHAYKHQWICWNKTRIFEQQTDIYTLTMLHFTFTRNKHNVHKICMEINREEQRHIPLSLSTEVPACHSMQMHTQSF